MYQAHQRASYAAPVPSLRLNSELERRLRQAAAQQGESLSEFFRKASKSRADAVLQEPAVDLSDVIGLVHSGGGQARRTGEAFLERLARDRPG